MAANRSSLELMLEKIQRLENLPEPDHIPPALPVRPVSRARLPRARRPLQLDFHFHSPGFEEESNGGLGYGRSGNKRTVTEEDYLIGIEATENSVTGICMIQKWYRGYRVRSSYDDLRRQTLALQAFVRGVNARKEMKARLKGNEINRNQRLRSNQDVGVTDETKVPYNVLVDLRRRVLTMEAKAREKNEECNVMKVRIREIEKKWQQYEERMKSQEKAWQDRLLYIQKCLGASKRHPLRIKFQKYDPSRNIKFQKYDPSRNSVANGTTLDLALFTSDEGHGCNFVENLEELGELKGRFKAWRKEYRNRLREVQCILKKVGKSQGLKSGKNWWGRLS